MESIINFSKRLLLTTLTVLMGGAGVLAQCPGGWTSQAFNFTGGAQTFTVPAGVTQVYIEASGAQGGNANVGGTGGLGAMVGGYLAVTPGQNLQVNVGGQTGFNGGGIGGLNGNDENGGPYGTRGGNGGGASDVRINANGLADRVIVGGGGGGAGHNGVWLGCQVSGPGGNGGGGGVTNGGVGTVGVGTPCNCGGGGGNIGGGGTQGAGGTPGGYAGSFNCLRNTWGPGFPGGFGFGGAGSNQFHNGTGGGGGGGGGYYGGGSGGNGSDTTPGGGGGGGSSYTGGVTSPTGTAATRSGDGIVTICYDLGGGCVIPGSITQTPANPVCGGNAILTAESPACNGGGGNYTVANIAFAPIGGVGTTVSLSDDQMSGALPVGFSFNFYGNNYSNFYISSNGFISFSAGQYNGCCGGGFVPSFGSDPTNFIAAAWDDLYPPGAGSVNYFTTGVAPNRILVVNWTNVPYCCNNTPRVTTQIQLYESTNIIEVHSPSIISINPGTQGIQNLNGSLGTVVAGRNQSAWSATNDAYRFSPPLVCTYAWSTGEVTQSIVVSVGGTYTVTITNPGGCTAVVSQVVTMFPAASPVTITQNPPVPLCDGNPVALTASSPDCGGGGNANVAYLVSNVEPQGWGLPSVANALNAVYGAGNWADLRIESVVASDVFNLANYGVIHLEGGNGATTELLAFMAANQSLIENWVAAGGVLLINYATNETTNDNLGFGGVQSIFDPRDPGSAAIPGHPIFNGPALPANGGALFGTSLSHNYIVNGGTTILQDDINQPTLTEMSWGSGYVFFGGLTLPFFEIWTPQPDIFNIYKNTYSYMSSLAGGGGCTYLWSTGETTASIMAPTGGPYDVTVTNGNGCTASATFDAAVGTPPTVTISQDPAPPVCGGTVDLTAIGVGGGGGGGPVNKAFLVSQVEPQGWGQPSCANALNSVYGFGGWSDFRVETVNPNTLFDINNFGVIHMEGGNSATSELVGFLSANQSLIENWVAQGGVLFINYATNENNLDNLGFGGVQSQRDPRSNGSVVAVGHPIFNGPLTPATGNFTGSSLSHNFIINGGNTLLQDNSARPTLTELTWGSGKVLFGGLTLPFFENGSWGPQPDIYNMYRNVYSYMEGAGGPAFDYAWSTGETTGTIAVGSNGTYCVTATDENGCTNSACIVVTIYTPPTVTISSNPPAPLCGQANATLTANGPCGGGGGNANVAFLVSQVEPQGFGQPSVANALNAVYGAGNWADLRIETVVPGDLFNNANFGVIHMEGSNLATSELLAFLSANQGLVENWVANGGVLLINYASNENFGVDNLGFGGVTFARNPLFIGNVLVPGHPIFNGPALPASGPFNGFNLSHNYITNGGTTLLEDEMNEPILTEKNWGTGRVLFGGLTLPFFEDGSWGPQPNVFNMYKNTYSYMSSLAGGGGNCCTYLWSTGETTADIVVTADGTYTVTLTDCNGCTGTAEQIVEFTNPVVTIDVDPVGPACGVQPVLNALVNGAGGAVTFTGTFVQGQDGQAFCADWQTFLASLTGTYTQMRIYSDLNAGITLNDPTTVNNIANALLNGMNTQFTFGPDTYFIGGCGAGTELAVNQSICNCASAISVRPCIGQFNSNWGGVNTATCFGPSQTITVEFGGGGNNTYLWNNGETTDEITATASGTYVVTVTTPGGCTASASVNVGVFNPPTVTITTNPNGPFCGLPSGELTADGPCVGAGGPAVVFAEKLWGAGKVNFGSMTMPDWHSPATEAQNFRTNILYQLFAAGPTFGASYYLESNSGGAPWGMFNNINAMNTIFGGGWNPDYFETANAGAIFSPGTSLVFMDGSDLGANELDAFFTANQATIEAWVAAGGRLFINAAPNEGGDMNWGFGGVTLDYNGGNGWLSGVASALVPGHPVFNAPFTPVQANYSGTSFAHAAITGAYGTALMEGDAILPPGGNCCSFLWSSGETTATITVTASGTYTVTLTDCNGCTNTAAQAVDFFAPTLTIETDPIGPACGVNPVLAAISPNCGNNGANVYYIRGANNPWGQTINQAAMDAVFGAGNWIEAFFNNEIGNGATIFSATTRFVFMDGSDGMANEMESFVNANIAFMEAWVATGGRLFMNAAPNQDNGMNWGFGGVQLNYPGFSGFVSTVLPGHPIFNGPYTPVSTSYTGNSYGHATIVGPSGTSLLDGDAPGVVLSELNWGTGLVMFGGMTTTNWHSPSPHAQNLRQNMVDYLNSFGGGGACTYLWSDGSTSQSITATASGTYDVTLTSPGGCTASASVNVTIYPAATATIIPGPNYCTQADLVAVGGGTGPFTYLWNTGETNDAITPNVAGIYSVTITDANGCTATAEFDAALPPTLIIEVDPLGPVCGVSPVLTAVASGAAVTYTETFLAGQGPPPALCNNWNAFIAQLTGTYSQMRMYSDLDPIGFTLSDAPTVNAIANTLLTNGFNTFFFAGDQFNVGNCGGMELSINQGFCSCGNAYALRPCIGADVWGGVNTPTCGGPTQTITVQFGAGNYTFLWNTGETTESITPNASGTYTVTLTTNGGCEVIATQVVTIFPAVTASIIGGLDPCALDAMMAVAGGGTAPFAYLWNTGETTDVIMPLAGGTYTVTITDASGCTATAEYDELGVTTVTIETDPVGPACGVNPILTAVSSNCGNNGVDVYYIRGVNNPWGQTVNQNAMNAVFGFGGWIETDFNSANGIAPAIFSPGTRFVFMDGSDGGANEMNNFVTNNIALMEAWVVSGGRLFMNSAPNQGGNMNWGFGGVQLTYPGFSGFVSTTLPGHPIFNGPFTPVSTSYTGGSYGHAIISGPGGTSLLDGDAPGVVLSELNWGAGLVMFGGMTTPNFHNPNPHGQNVRQNMLDYLNNFGGGGGCTYAWSTGATDMSITAVADGTYDVTVTTSFGCTASATINVVLYPAASATIVPTPNYCVDASIQAVAGGAAPFTYLWTTGETTDAITPNVAGIYTVTITDANGCTATAEFDAALPPTLTIEVDPAGPACGISPVLTAVASGAAVTYTETFFAGQGPPPANCTNWNAFIAQLTGTYSQMRMYSDLDPVGFTLSDAPTVNAIANTLLTNGFNTFFFAGDQINVGNCGGMELSINQGFCSCGNAYAIRPCIGADVWGGVNTATCGGPTQTITVQFGAGNYTFLWNTGETTESITPLVSGTYTVTLTTGGGCEVVATQVVTIFPAVTATINGGIDLCALDPMTAVAGGGTAPFNYLWNTGETTDVITPGASGTYSVTITDASGCTATAEYDESAAPVVNVVANPVGPACGVAPVLTANVIAGGASQLADVLAAIDNNAGMLIGLVPNPSGFNMDQGVNGNSISDGCSDMYDGGNSINTNFAGGIQYSDGVITPSGAFGAGGQYFTRYLGPGGCQGGPATMWFWAADLDGVTNAFTSGNNGADGQGNENGLTFTVANGINYNCFVKRVFNAFDPSINQLFIVPNGGGVSQFLPGNTDNNYHELGGLGASNRMYYLLYAGANGFFIDDVQTTAIAQAFVNLLGAGVTYQWSEGSTTASITPGVSGNYCVTVTDQNGCTGTACYNLVVNPALTATIAGGIDICAYDPMTAVAGGGTAPFTYLWNTGETTDVITPTASGTYTVTITDAAGCTATAEYEESAAPAVSISTDLVAPFCAVSPVLTADVVGGVAAVTYTASFLQGQTPGQQCFDWDAFRAQLSGTYTQMRVFSDLNSGITLNDPATVNAIANALLTGTGSSFSFGGDTYNIGLGCGPGNVVELSINQGLCQCGNSYSVRPCIGNDNWGGVNGPTCTAQSQTITVEFSGAAITYLWSDGSTTESITPGAPGNYCVTVTDDNGCASTACYNLMISNIAVSGVATDVTCNAANGSIDLTATGAIGPVTYLWDNGATDEDLTGLAAGTYTVTATDVNGCTATASVTVNATPDTESPVITCPGNIVLNADLGACGTIATYNATVTDNCPIGLTLVYSPVNASVFPTGTTMVTATATDASGNMATCTFNVTVNDTEFPSITCPATQTLTNAVSVTLPDYTVAATDNCPGTLVTQSPAIGTVYNTSQTVTVVLTATDASGNATTCAFDVVINITGGCACPFVAGVVYVDDNAVGANTGLNWCDAYTSLQSALAAVGAGGQIWVKEGWYYPTAGVTRTATFNLKPNMSMYGGFPDNMPCPGMGDRNADTYLSNLSGDIGTLGVNTDNSYRVVRATNVGASVLVDGVVIRDGYADVGANINGAGLGVTANGAVSSPSFINCDFVSNYADTRGAGAFLYSLNAGGVSNTSFTDCNFMNNVAGADGGGVSTMSQAGATFSGNFDNCSFTNNNGGLKGGGVGSWVNAGGGSTLNYSDCTFTGNTAITNGGGIWHYSRTGGALTYNVDGCSFTGNSSANGAAMYHTTLTASMTGTAHQCTFMNNASANYGTITTYSEKSSTQNHITIDECTFTNNTSLKGGGLAQVALTAAASTATVTQSTFGGNTGSGGGSYHYGSGIGTSVGATLENNDYYGNTSPGSGGAIGTNFIGSSYGDLFISFCSFSANAAATNGGAVQNFTNSGATNDITASNSIFYGNTVTAINGRTFGTSGAGASTDVLYSIVDNGVCAANHTGTGVFTCGIIVAMNPMFVSPSNLELTAGSPAIDIVGSGPAEDIDGNARPFGLGWDWGAHEYGAVLPRVAASEPTATSENLDMTLFPNPTTDAFTVQFTRSLSGTVEIIDLQGRVLHTELVNDANQLRLTLDGRASGTYYVRLISANDILVRKVLLHKP